MSKYDDLRRMREARYAPRPVVEAPKTAPPVPALPPFVAAGPALASQAGFDRKAYQREYMREYMRKRRARPAQE
jgi:hypothetical protein